MTLTQTITNGADLGRVQVALIEFGWFHFAVVDKNRCAWLLCEHEDGEMYATCGSEDGWLPALRVVQLHGPLTVLQDLSPKPFGRPAAPLGEPTDRSLHQILGSGKWDDCRHCACVLHAECCYCDGGQVHSL